MHSLPRQPVVVVCSTEMAAMMEPSVLSRSGVFQRLGSLLSDVSSANSSEPPIVPTTARTTTDQTNNNSVAQFDTAFAHLFYRLDLSTIEHVHLRCRPASSFNSNMHTSLCEAVLGIYPDTSVSTSSNEAPVLVRGVIERRHRRIKAGDWLLAINGTRLTWQNLHDLLSKYHSARKLRLTVRHPIHNNSTFASSLQPPIALPSIEEKKLVIPESVDCIHSVLYYEKRPEQGFKLLYQHPSQKDIFFAAGGLFPALTQLMHDMNEHDSLLRSISIKLAEQNVHVCVSSDDHLHYLIIVYPPIDNLHVCLLEQHTVQLIRLIKFLFGSIERGLHSSSESMEYFFQILFYRLFHLTNNASSSIFKHVRLVDEFLPAQFDQYGTCPKFVVRDQHLLTNMAHLLNQLECQNINECSNEDDFIINRYRRAYFVLGSVLFHRLHLVISHLSNELTTDIYRFLLHYGHINMSQLPSDTWQLLLFKEIFPVGAESKQRSFLLVCSQNELTLAVIIESEYETNDLNISPDHGLIQQIKLTLNDIYSIFPQSLANASPWIIAAPAVFVRKQLKRTLSLPLIGGFGQSATKGSNLDETASLVSSQHHDQSLTDLRVAQLVSQPESQDELYKSSRQSLVSSTLSLDEQQHHSLQPTFSSYRLHPGPCSTIFYYLDFQSVRSLLIAPYFTLDKVTQSTLIDRHLFETIQHTCIYLRRKHFAFDYRRRTNSQRTNLYSTKPRPKYQEIGCQFSMSTDPDKSAKKKKDGHHFNFWIVGRKCFQPVEHDFFVCYHDSIAQNITELAFTIGMSMD